MVVPIELLRILGIAQRSGEIGHRNSRLSHKSKCHHSESERTSKGAYNYLCGDTIAWLTMPGFAMEYDNIANV